MWSTKTIEFIGNQEGLVKKIHCVEVEWEKIDGVPVPRGKTGTDFSLEADMVLLALGFAGPVSSALVDLLGLERDQQGNLTVDDNHMTGVDGIFSAGDMARGQSLVVRAMADGIKAAEGINRYIS